MHCNNLLNTRYSHLKKPIHTLFTYLALDISFHEACLICGHEYDCRKNMFIVQLTGDINFIPRTNALWYL